MKLLGNFGSTISDGAKVVTGKTKKVTGIASLKSQIASTKSSLDKLYKDLGKAYFENPNAGEAVEDIITEIKNTNEKVAILEKKLSVAQGKIKCECCGEFINAEFAYCPKCGAEIVTVKEEEKVKVSLKEKIDSTAAKVKEFAQEKDIKERIDTAGEKIKNFAEEKELKEKIDTAGQKLKNFAEEKELKDKLGNAGETAKEVAKELGSKMGSALSGAKDYISKMKNPEDIVDADDAAKEPSINSDDIVVEETAIDTEPKAESEVIIPAEDTTSESAE